jgi:hypothetical protein
VEGVECLGLLVLVAVARSPDKRVDITTMELEFQFLVGSIQRENDGRNLAAAADSTQAVYKLVSILVSDHLEARLLIAAGCCCWCALGLCQQQVSLS